MLGPFAFQLPEEFQTALHAKQRTAEMERARSPVFGIAPEAEATFWKLERSEFIAVQFVAMYADCVARGVEPTEPARSLMAAAMAARTGDRKVYLPLYEEAHDAYSAYVRRIEGHEPYYGHAPKQHVAFMRTVDVIGALAELLRIGEYLGEDEVTAESADDIANAAWGGLT